jgi:hypothetical protein
LLKILDKDNKVKFILEDEDQEPQIVKIDDVIISDNETTKEEEEK